MFEECLRNLSGEFQIWYKQNKKRWPWVYGGSFYGRGGERKTIMLITFDYNISGLNWDVYLLWVDFN